MSSGAPRRVRIDHGPAASAAYGPAWAVVGIDIFRATSVITTAVASGRSCHLAATREEALALAARLPDSLLGGEQGGVVPGDFDLGNSPSALARRDDVHRALVLLTSSGTPLLRGAQRAGRVYAASLRNVSGQVRHLVQLSLDVVVIAAGTRGERRREDEYGAAQVAAGLIAAGFEPDPAAEAVVSQYAHLDPEICATGRSAAFLRRTGRQDDIDFVLEHQDDLDATCQVDGSGVTASRAVRSA